MTHKALLVSFPAVYGGALGLFLAGAVPMATDPLGILPVHVATSALGGLLGVVALHMAIRLRET